MGEETTRVNLALVSQQVDNVQQAVEKMDEKHTAFCDKIEMSISGDPADPLKPGLAGQVRKNRSDINSIQTWGKRLLALLTAILSGISVALFGRWGK